MDLESFVGLAPDALPLRDRLRLTGKWIAFELYTPKTLPMRLIAAIGDTPADVIRMLRRRGLDPVHFEVTPLTSPV